MQAPPDNYSIAILAVLNVSPDPQPQSTYGSDVIAAATPTNVNAGPLPLHSGVEAWNAVSAIELCLGGVHLPQDLRHRAAVGLHHA